jgi:hypothetical protein
MVDRRIIFFVVIAIVIIVSAVVLLNNHLENTKFDFKTTPGSELQYLEGNQTQTLVWEAKNFKDPTHYQILVDGELAKNESWDGSEIMVRIYELQLDPNSLYNPHNVTCVIFDDVKGNLSHSVQITVVSIIEQKFNLLNDVVIIAGFILIVGSILLVIIGYIRKQTSR